MIGQSASKPLLPSLMLTVLALPGCTSTDAMMGMTPRADIGNVATYAAPTPQTMIAPAPQQPLPAAQPAFSAPATAAAGEPVQFLPIIGAPEAKVAQLAEALSTHAGATGIEIVAANAGTAPKRLKGYLSAFNDGSKTTVIYVWDVLDSTDARVNRIQGQETVPGATSDPWSAVGADTLDAIARRTLQETASL